MGGSTAERATDVCLFLMTSLEAEGGFLHPLLLYCSSAEEHVILERALQKPKAEAPSHQLKMMALNFLLIQTDGWS